MNGKRLFGLGAVVGLVLIVGLALAGWTLVSAQTTKPPTNTAPTGAKVVSAAGKITAISGSGFTLDTRQGAVNVTVNAQTWIVVGSRDAANNPTGPAEGTLANLSVGQFVNVAGTSPAAGQITARVVSEGPAFGPAFGFGGKVGPGREGPGGFRPGPFPGPKSVQGTIAAIQNGTVSLTLDDGTKLDVVTNAATVVLKNGFATLADLKVGDKAQVVPALMMGRRVEWVGPPGGMPGPGSMGPGGMAEAGGMAVSGDMMGPDTMIVQANVPGGENAQPVPPNGAPSTQATMMGVAAIWVPQNNDRLVLGMVEAVNGNNVTVRGPDGAYTVQLGTGTAYKQVTGGDTAPTSAAQADVKQKTFVLVVGSDVSGQANTVAAKAVIVGPPK